MTPAPAPSPHPFTLRACLLLCLPALLLAAWLRLQFMLSIPEIYYGPDSNSYFDTALNLWKHHAFVFAEKRRGLYPLLLALAPLLPGSTAQVVALLQHALGLLAIPAIGWITGHVVRRPALWVPVTTCFAAFTPAALWYEHEMIADAPLYIAFLIALALAFPVAELRGRRLAIFLLAAWVVVAMKPHGRPLWAGLIVAVALLRWPVWRWPRSCLAVLAASFAVILGTGSAKQGSWLLLSSTLPLVPLEGEKFADYRRLLAPLVTELRQEPEKYPARQFMYKKGLSSKNPDGPLGPEWPPLVRDKKRYAAATKALAREAILQHPLQFLRFTGVKMAMCAWGSPRGEFYFAPANFWTEQETRNEGRWRRAGEMPMIYERDEPGYHALVAERRARPARVPSWPLQTAAALTWIERKLSADGVVRHALTWVGWLGLLGVAALAVRRRWDAALLLLLPAVLYLCAIYAIGDAITRYFLPVEWLGILFACLGLDALLSGALRLRPARVHPEVVEQKL